MRGVTVCPETGHDRRSSRKEGEQLKQWLKRLPDTCAGVGRRQGGVGGGKAGRRREGGRRGRGHLRARDRVGRGRGGAAEGDCRQRRRARQGCGTGGVSASSRFT